jgi:hypothetical protein
MASGKKLKILFKKKVKKLKNLNFKKVVDIVHLAL